jgi:hypothetical protein
LYDALHLTERIRAYDGSLDAHNIQRGTYATNETHTIDRQLIRMMLALPDLVLKRGIRFQLQLLVIDTDISNRVLPSSCHCAYVHGA